MDDETPRTPQTGDSPATDPGGRPAQSAWGTGGGTDAPDSTPTQTPQAAQQTSQHYPGYGQQQPYGYGPPPGQPYGWQQQTATMDRPTGQGGRGKLMAGVAAMALLVGGTAGGVGGVVAYNVAGSGPAPVNALDQPVPAQQTANAPAGSVEQVAQRVLPSVVQLQVRGAQVAGEGSGVVLSSDGLVLTNNHVVEAAAGGGGEITAVFQDGRQAPAQIVGRAPGFDLAVVKVQGVNNLTPATLGSSEDLTVGQDVIAVGSPLGLSGTVTTGIVSALDRPVRAGGEGSGQDTVLSAVQTDAAINPGNSGGPLVDMQGRVIGINSAIATTGGPGGQSGSIGLGFAIPVDQAKRVADELVENGVATQAVLGVTTPTGGAQPATGAVVSEVVPDGAAAAAGIKPGDVITRVNGDVIESGDALVAAIRSQPPSSPAEITLLREGSGERTVELTLGSQPVPAQN